MRGNFLLGLSFFFGFFDIVNIGLALPKIMSTFNVTSEQATLAITTSLIGYIIGAIVISIYADHYGRKPALMSAILLYSLGSLCCAFSHSFDQILFWRFFTGLGLGSQIAVSTTYSSEMAAEQARGKINSIIVACGMFGFAIVPFIAYALVPHFEWGWRGLFAIGALGGVLLVFFWRKLPDSQLWLEQNKKNARGKAKHQLQSLFKWKSLLSLILFIAIWFIYYIGNYGWLTLATTLLYQHGFALSQSIFFVTLTSIGFVLGSIVSIIIGDRFERKKACASIALVWVLALLVVGFVDKRIAIVLGGLVASASIAMIIPQMYTLTAEQFPTPIRSTCISITDGVGHLGGAFCGQIIFFFANSLQVHLEKFKGALLAMAITGLITVLLLLFAKNMTAKSLE